MLFFFAAMASASAQEPAAAPPDTDPALERRIADLEARIQALEAANAEARQEALLREAESMAAASAPPPPAPPAPPNVFNPRITAFGDVLASLGVSGGRVMPGSGPWIRSLELDIRADVDPFAKAVAILSVEREPPLEGEDPSGEPWSASPEEVYVDIVSLPAGFSARLGRFLQPFGITNRSHPHDFPWTAQPPVIAGMLGSEGLNEVGGTVSWRVPNPWDKGLSLTAGASRGERFDPTDPVPAWLGRAEYFDQAGDWLLGAGVSATGKREAGVAGADLVVRWKKNSWRSVLLLVEALADRAGSRGGYAALQLQPTRPLYLGLRADLLDGAWGYGAFASFYTTEFLRLRAGLTSWKDMTEADAQLTFVWGSHPVEPYWVNR